MKIAEFSPRHVCGMSPNMPQMMEELMHYHDDPRLDAWLRFWDFFTERLLRGQLADTVPRLLHREHVLAWRHGDHLDHARLLSWSRPACDRPRAPWITRVSVNHVRFQPSAATLRWLLFPRRGQPQPTPDLHVEWTALDTELEALARWLPTFMRGQLDPSVPVPPPPVPSHVFGEGLRETEYAWTAAAWEAFHGKAGESAAGARLEERATGYAQEMAEAGPRR